MSKVQVRTEIDLHQLLSQLDTKALEKLLRALPEIIGKRKSAPPRLTEPQLLERLNNECSLPTEHWEKLHELNAKKDSGTISELELKSLFSLIKEEEKLRLHRIEILGKLAQLRGTSITEVATNLGINTPQHG